LLRIAAEVLTMCCFFVAAWVHPCCIGMTGVSSYKEKTFFLFRFVEGSGAGLSRCCLETAA
jgi:hypothetical protein